MWEPGEERFTDGRIIPKEERNYQCVEVTGSVSIPFLSLEPDSWQQQQNGWEQEAPGSKER